MSFAIPYTFHPTNIGYTPTGYSAGSQIILGGNPSGSWEAIGLGQHGRPDYVERVLINLIQPSGVTTPTRRAAISMNIVDLQTIITGRPHAPVQFNFALKEVYVCEGGVTKAMAILASQTYPTGTAP